MPLNSIRGVDSRLQLSPAYPPAVRVTPSGDGWRDLKVTAFLPAWRDYGVAAALYTVLGLLMAHQLVGALGHAVPAMGDRPLENDALYGLWAIAWGAHALATAPAELFHANAFYPERYTLAYSDHLLGVAPLFAALQSLTGSPVAAFNLYYLMTFPLTGLATFALVRAWTGSMPASLVGGLVFAFAPPRIAHHFHIHLLGIWWMPLTLLFVERFLRQPTAGRAALAAVGFVMQWLYSIYLGWVLTWTLAVYLLAAGLAEPRAFTRPKLWLLGVPAAALAGGILLPTLLPYLVVSERWAFRWPLAELVSHSASLTSFLHVPPTNLLYGRLLRPFADGGVEKQLFLGIGPIVLASVGVVASLRRGSGWGGSELGLRGHRWLALTLLALAVVSCVLTFGPYAGEPPTVPLPYLALYEWVPGFGGMRNPTRFIFVIALVAAVLAGLGVAAILQRLRGTAAWLVGGFLVALACVELFSVLRIQPFPERDPEAHAYLRATAADGPIVVLPIGRDREVAESPRMASSVFHWRPMVNGNSSFRPPTYEELAAVFRNADPGAMADAFQVLGLTTMVLHLDELTPAERARLDSPEWQAAGFRERARTSRTAIWTLAPGREPRSTAALQIESRMPRAVTAGSTVTMRLLFLVEEGQIFHDSAGGARPLHAQWIPLDSDGLAVEQELLVSMPRVVVPRPQVKTEFALTAPPRPGRYSLMLRGEHLAIERTVVVSPREAGETLGQ